MRNRKRKLTSLEVNRIKEPGKHPLGENLYLQVSKSGTRSWIFRYTLDGKGRWMGLGSASVVSLAKARDLVVDQKRILQKGLDPLKKRAFDLKEEQAKSVTFKQCAENYIEAHKPKWKSRKNLIQWQNSLATYAYPVCGDLPVGEIDTATVMKILKPIWYEKTETASRVRARVERILSWATVQGYRNGENPAQWRGHLDQLLPNKSTISKTNHFKAMPFDEVGFFIKDLRAMEGIASRAMEFLILTATRTNETLEARWDEINLDEKVWTIPATRMKAKREHKIPLSHRCIQLLLEMRDLRCSEFVFPGTKHNHPLSNMSLLMILRRMDLKFTTHGFRSSFSDWAAERTNITREVVEMALAHTIKNKVEAAYRRGDLMLKRKKLMDTWAEYCSIDDNSNAHQIVELQFKEVN